MKRTSVAVALAFSVVACTELEPTAMEKPATTRQFGAQPTWGLLGTDLLDLLGAPTPWIFGFANGFVHQVTAQSNNPAALDRIFKRWLAMVVSNSVNTSTWDVDLYAAVRNYLGWRSFALLNVPNTDVVFGAEIDAFRQAIAAKLALAIDGNLTLCGTSQTLEPLANAIFWFDQAQALGLAGQPYWPLTRAELFDLIEQDCVNVIVQSIQFPNPVDVGQQFLLRTISAIQFVGQTTTQPAAFMMTIAINANGAFLTEFTDAAGLYETLTSIPTAGQFSVFASACLVLPNRTGPIDVCADRTVTGQAIDPLPPPPPPGNCSGTLTAPVSVVNVSTLNAVAGYTVIDGDLRIFANDSLVNVTFPCLRTVTGSLNITNNRALTQIAFPQLVEVGRFLSLILNPIVVTAQFPALQQVGQVGSTPGTFPGAFAINSNPLLSTLDIGAVTIHRNAPVVFGGLQLMLPHSLTTLNGLSTGIAVDTLFFTLPAAGQPGLTKAQFQAYKASAPAVLQVCELPFGAGGARVCL